MIRAVLFDLDGTLVQSEKLKALSYAIAVQRLRGLAEPDPQAVEAYREIVGAARDVASRHVMERLGLEADLRPRMAEYSVANPWEVLSAIRKGIYNAMVADPKVIRENQWPHTVALLRMARERYCHTALATMSQRAEALHVLRALDLERALDLVLSIEDVKKPKPDPEIYLLAAERLQAPAAECLVIEDSPNGVLAGLAAGMNVVAVATPFTAGGLHATPAVKESWIVHNPDELLEVVQRRITEHNREAHHDVQLGRQTVDGGRETTTARPGYRQDLFVLPFDHRRSFEEGLFGIRGRDATPTEREQIAAYKQMIYEGLLLAIEHGVPRQKAAVLVDQTYGQGILADAARRQIATCVPVEKSGQEEFDFEYGDDFRAHLQEAAPAFAKALVRYNPDDDRDMTRRQQERLRLLSGHTRSAGYRFMFELLVPPTQRQLERYGQDRRSYDRHLRPELTVRAMNELQAAGIEPDVWKLEGTDDPKAARAIVAQACAGGRDGVGVIVLGRGENEERVNEWLATGARTHGVIGFAVGRTVFWQPLLAVRDSKLSRAGAIARIAETYQRFYRLFIEARAAS